MFAVMDTPNLNLNVCLCVCRLTCSDQSFYTGFATADLEVKLYAMTFKKVNKKGKHQIDK